MLQTSTAFKTKHDLDYKTPVYLVHFDGETTDYSNHAPGSTSNTVKKYLMSISGISRRIMPEEGKSSVSGATVKLLDYNDEITALLATDANYFHRKKTEIKAGYAGLNESNMETILTGWVTGIKLSSDGTSYEFSITDPQKWMQRKIFRSATDAAPVTISGNPLNILLALLTSTGNGTNGDYDIYASENGLGIEDDYINVAALENLRDTWYAGASHYMYFTIKKRIKARDFFEQEIFKPLNLYPVIDGYGRFSARRFTPPLATSEQVQTYDEDNMIGLPAWDANLSDLINEAEFFYNHDGDDYQDEVLYIDGDSISGRGPGKKPATIKSKGLHTSLSPGSLTVDVANIIARRKNVIFNRFTVPPIKLNISAWFTRWISEVGDIVPITHSKLPDIENGSRGLDEARMEIVSKTIDYKNGKIKIEAMDTGFAKDIYFVFSPSMTVVFGISSTQFYVTTADADKYANFANPEIRVCDNKMRTKAASVTITAIDTELLFGDPHGKITCDDIGSTPAAGWLIVFADYDNCTDEQKLYGFLSDSNDYLGAANDDAHLIVP